VLRSEGGVCAVLKQDADELLNRIWYAGAYTNQICTIDPKHGDSLVHIFQINASVSDATNVTWYYNYTITSGESALVDGAKRDRLVWAGGEFAPRLAARTKC
jgi:hypothetical protein